MSIEMLLFSAIAMSAGGMLMQSSAQASAQKYNEQLARQQAEAQRVRGELERQQILRQKQKTLAAQRAAYGAAGVKQDGSPLEVMLDTAMQFELDMKIADYNSKVDISQSLTRASQARTAASDATTAGVWGATGSLLSGMYEGKKEGIIK